MRPNATTDSSGAAFHEFAWDGLSFSVPADWNLALYSYRNRVVSVRMEDDEAVRLELDWTRPPRPVEASEVSRRLEKLSEPIRRSAAATEELRGLPPGWGAFLYTIPDGRRFIAAFHLAAGGRLFCFFRLHFDAEGGRKVPERVFARLVSSFRVHEQGLVPWKFYDVSFRLPREFRLRSTSLMAGRKGLVFEWRLRRLHLWFFSFADMLLAGRQPEAWAVDFLRGCKAVRGPAFSLGADGAIRTRRSAAFPLGHFEELGRWSFRYRVICRHDPARNTLALALFQHRSAADLARLGLEFDGDTVRPAFPS